MMADGLVRNDALLSAAAGELKVVLADLEAAEINDPHVGYLIDRHDDLIAFIENTDATGPLGLVGKASAVIAEGPEHKNTSRLERIALSLARDVMRLGQGE